jgi:hypothetical protein
MLSYNLTEWENFDENIIGAFMTLQDAIDACRKEANVELEFTHSNIRGGYWWAEDSRYLPHKRATWFYVFSLPVERFTIGTT